ncbi:hypothetical protein RFI_09042 [Reticulomyxa filosa]|uniref:RRM domain-containing protein n=1 Tax=Reticulomyxa filosa TaxID=46433 RepID=X6NQV0_RETFI|nr:hypothetical protein RFI_09042 [Reticulomyxa filosa]|eukprot:ETO28089.1 hypothetical protein RFI_09042 [Reticulomyxa filosa]
MDSAINVTIGKNSNLFDLKAILFDKYSIDVYNKYQMLIDGKKACEDDDKLLCVNFELSSGQDEHKKKIQIVPSFLTPMDHVDKSTSKEVNNSAKANNNESNSTPTISNTNNTSTNNTDNSTTHKGNSTATANATTTAEQIQMLKDYADVFGLEEAAAMCGLDYKELKAAGYDVMCEKKQTFFLLKKSNDNKIVICVMFGQKLFEELTKGNIPPELLNSESKNEQVMQTNTVQQDIPSQEDLDTLAAAAAASSFLGLDPTALPDPMLAQQTASLFAANMAANMYGNLANESSHGASMGQPPPPGVLDSCAVFIGDLHPLVTKEDLFKVFSSTGTVLWVQLFDCHKQLQRPFNFAFVYFENPRDGMFLCFFFKFATEEKKKRKRPTTITTKKQSY